MAETTNTHEPANGVYGVLTAGNFKPILFSTPMVQAILRGEKTQTRRIIPEKIVDEYYNYDDWCSSVMPSDIPCSRTYEHEYFMNRCKYSAGDILWVRETWHPKRHNMPTGWKYEYKATAKEDGNPTDEPWKPSIFMPKDACRIFLKITKIRIERLQNISEKDAISEGIVMNNIPHEGWYWMENIYSTNCPVLAYEKLWKKINGEKSWNDNPWVFVYEFERTDASFACR